MRASIPSALLAVVLAQVVIGVRGASTPLPPEADRAPLDIAIVRDERALVVNHASDSAMLIDWHNVRVLAEAHTGRKPCAVAVAADGKLAAVNNLWSGTVTLLEVSGTSLHKLGDVAVGPFPRGLAFAPDATTLYVALAGRDEVVAVNVPGRTIVKRWPAPREPRQVAVSGDGRWLAAASSRSAQVRCWELPTGKLHWERTIFDGFNLRGLNFTADNKYVICSHQIRRDFPVSRGNIEEGWVIDNRLSRFAVSSAEEPNSWQIALDLRGLGAADPEGTAFAEQGETLALAVGGTHELLLLRNDAIPWTPGDPGDFLDFSLEKEDRLRRVPLGGRPVAVATPASEPTMVLVANYLLDAVQVVDVKRARITRAIHLGGPKTATLARQGEAIFYDAGRSHHQWFSCHSCHVDGHTCGLPFDTLNDDSYGNPKMTPSLRNVTRTGPWTWHGWQKDLNAAVAKSITTTMSGPEPTAKETSAVVAYLETLQAPPNPQRNTDGSLTPAAQRGEALFYGKAGCVRCHRGDYYTSPRSYDVHLDGGGSPHHGFNPPSLIGLYDRGPFLHDGRAFTLDQLLKLHGPDQIGGEPLQQAEKADLFAFLNSL